jgi:hypothetical protein
MSNVLIYLQPQCNSNLIKKLEDGMVYTLVNENPIIERENGESYTMKSLMKEEMIQGDNSYTINCNLHDDS